ncbi:MAG: hypothetical protein GF401_02050 [Chitinivibrionales bacterium]|nr:hypothetical protein [Chitinivibrionales bacterium]
MFLLKYLFVCDMAVILLMLLLSYLSRRLGEALKIAPYYRILYGTCMLIFIAFTIDTLHGSIGFTISETLPMIIRFAAILVAAGVCFRYWNWLFSEHLKR